jgi:hypothetical protein
MESIDDPDTALQLHPDWVAFRFKDSEWVFGHGIDSHGFRSGSGTLVVKDSRGRVRIFFGHVCGTNGPMWFEDYAHKMTLDEFYERVTIGDILREWIPD